MLRIALRVRLRCAPLRMTYGGGPLIRRLRRHLSRLRARSHSGSDSHLGCHSTPSRRFTTHQLCRSVFSVPEIAVPQNAASAVRKAERLGVVGPRTNGFDLMGGFFWEPHHANRDPPSRMDSDVSRFVGSAVCMGADGCLHKSVNIPTVLFSPQWVFTQYRLIYIHEKSVRRKFFSVQSIPWIV